MANGALPVEQVGEAEPNLFQTQVAHPGRSAFFSSPHTDSGSIDGPRQHVRSSSSSGRSRRRAIPPSRRATTSASSKTLDLRLGKINAPFDGRRRRTRARTPVARPRCPATGRTVPPSMATASPTGHDLVDRRQRRCSGVRAMGRDARAEPQTVGHRPSCSSHRDADQLRPIGAAGVAGARPDPCATARAAPDIFVEVGSISPERQREVHRAAAERWLSAWSRASLGP